MTMEKIREFNDMIEEALSDSGLNNIARLCEKAPMSLHQMDDGPDALAEHFFAQGEKMNKTHEAQWRARELARAE